MFCTPRVFWYITQAMDYSFLLIWILFYNWTINIFGPGSLAIQLLHWVAMISSAFQDSLFKAMFPHPHLIPKHKLEAKMSFQEVVDVLFAGSISCLLWVVLSNAGLLDLSTRMDRVESIVYVWVEFNLTLLLLDAHMFFIHKWMHQSAWAFTKLHAKHHKNKLNCQAHHGFAFDLSDLAIEFALAPIIFLGLKQLIGLPVTMTYASLLLYATAGIRVHSCNPHRPYFFNPLLDSLSKSTIRHGLHHALGSQYITSTSIAPAQKRKDILRYEEVFGVDLGYANVT